MDKINSNNQVSHKLISPFEAYDGDEDYIFVSYKHKDADIVYPVIKQFHDMGFNIWYDDGLPYGENFDIVIPNKIKGAALFINFLTNECMACANNSEDYMIKESEIAKHVKKPILTIYLEPDVELDGYYLTNYLNRQSLNRNEYGDNEDMFIDECINAFKSAGVEPNEIGSESPGILPPFPAYNDDEPYIFINYVHDDSDMIFPVLERFKEEHFNIWYDQGVSDMGWVTTAINRLKDSALFVSFISSNSIKSNAFLKEITIASSLEIPIVLIFLEETELPPDIKLSLDDYSAIFKYLVSEKDFISDCADSFNKYLKPQ